jgi:hypothetical protein
MQEAIVFIATGLDEVAYRRALGTLQRPAAKATLHSNTCTGLLLVR